MTEVSVIIPVFNNSDGLSKVLNALINQSYLKANYEIIVVDNGSTDNSTLDVALTYKKTYGNFVHVLEEKTLRGSYAARNSGIKYSQGKLIALIDSDCIPGPNWLENGLEAMKAKSADMIGGRVKFFYPPNPSAAEIYDSLTHMQVKHAIETNSTSPAANLFVQKYVFEKIGLFPSNLTSGGDTIWTSRATRTGFKLEYAPEAEVLHPARNLRELLTKRLRVASGHYAVWQNRNKSWSAIIIDFLRYLLPPRTQYIKKLIEDRGSPELAKYFWSIWFVAWICRYATNTGRVLYFLGKTSR